MKLYLVKSEPAELKNNEPGAVEIYPPSGMAIVSGGGGGDPRLRTWLSKPLPDGGWQVGATNDIDNNAVNLFAWALCSPDAEFITE
jgi:hypothetical protein